MAAVGTAATPAATIETRRKIRVSDLFMGILVRPFFILYVKQSVDEVSHKVLADYHSYLTYSE